MQLYANGKDWVHGSGPPFCISFFDATVSGE